MPTLANKAQTINQETVLSGWLKNPKGKLRWTQTFFGNGQCPPPSCDNKFSHGLAKRMYNDAEHTEDRRAEYYHERNRR